MATVQRAHMPTVASSIPAQPLVLSPLPVMTIPAPLRCLVTLSWLTGEDGRVSFSKLVLVVLLWMLGVVLWHVVDYPNLVEALWPLVWLFALLMAGSYGLKGLQLWFSAARLRTEAQTGSYRIVTERRDPVEGIDPAP